MSSEELFDDRLAVATKLHHQGDIARAAEIYQQLHQIQPQRLDVIHNLGAVYIGLGKLKEGVALVSQAINSDPSNLGMKDSPKMLGMALFKSKYWIQAKEWLLEAAQRDPDDLEVCEALARISPRDYLQPERFDPLSKSTLKRYSPKEADTYIYTIDVVGNCNLRCPSCPVGNSNSDGRDKRMMQIEVFDEIISKIERETPSPNPQIWLYNWGEPLLHPKLPKMIKRIQQAGYRSYLSSNLNVEKGLKELIKANPTELKVSLSGFKPNTYDITHAGGDINLVKSNLYRLRKYLDHYQSQTRIWIGHHIYKTNQDEVAEVKKICQELSFEHHPIQAFYQPLEKLIKLAKGDQEVRHQPIMSQFLVPIEQQVEFSKKHRSQGFDCELRFNQTVINSDASVALCCSQYDAKNALGIDFINYSHEEIEDRKYRHQLCKECRHLGLDYSPKKLPISLSPNYG